MQLRQSGALDGVVGIVFGDMKGCSPALDADYSLEDVILEALAGLEVPDRPGPLERPHPHPFVTLPLGVRARLDCGDEAPFELLEAAVS
jgi:muramoyltetrapeptide carboxypeptidase